MSLVTGTAMTLFELNGSFPMTPRGAVIPDLNVFKAVTVNAKTGDILVASERSVWRISSDASTVYPVAGLPLGQSNDLCAPSLPFPAQRLCFVNLDAMAFAQDVGVALLVDYGPINVVFAVNTTGAVNASAFSWAGIWSTYRPDDGGSFTAATISLPLAVVVTSEGDIVFTENDSRVRRISAATGAISSTISRTLTSRTGAIAAYPSSGLVAVADTRSGVLRVDAFGNSTVIANVSQFPPGAFIGALACDAQTLDLYATVAIEDSGTTTGSSVYRIDGNSGNAVLVVGGDSSGLSFPASVNTAVPAGLLVYGDALLIADPNSHTIHALQIRPRISSAHLHPFAGKACYTMMYWGGLLNSGGYSGDGGLATDACLNQPSTLATDNEGGVVFIDQINNVVRRVDRDGIIATLYSQRISTFWGVAVDPAGNIILSSRQTSSGQGALYILITSTRVMCPRGYACPLGRPVPCDDPSTFCPPNSWTPISPNKRRALSARVMTPSGVWAYTSQEVCTVGSYCIEGVKKDCPSGSLGLLPGGYSVAACAPCRPGSFSPLAGPAATECRACPLGAALPPDATGASQCVWCPVNTVGGGGINQCVACPRGSYSLGGPTACVPLPANTSLLFWDDFTTLSVQQSLESTPLSSSTNLGDSVSLTSIADVRVAVGVAIAIAVGIASLMLLYVYTHTRCSMVCRRTVRSLDSYR